MHVPAAMLASRNQPPKGTPITNMRTVPTANKAPMIPPPTAIRCMVIPGWRFKSLIQKAYTFSKDGKTIQKIL